MGATDDDDASSDHWPWNDKTFERMQANHDKFMRGEQLDKDTTEAARSPFASFKRFVDASVGSLSDHFRNYPTNVREFNANMQRQQEQYQQEELDISQRWTGSSSSPDHICMELARGTDEEKDAAHEWTVRLLSTSFERNENTPVEQIKRLYDDPKSDLGLLDQLGSSELAHKVTSIPSEWLWRSPEPRWLSVNWFKRSPYSPVRLEAHPDLAASGAKWRAAFEDLLRASLDKHIGSEPNFGYRTPHGKLQSTLVGPGLDWMLSLQYRGILPPQLPRFWKSCDAEQPLESLLPAFPWNSKGLPWPSDSAFKSRCSLDQDFSYLMAEIATKSTTDTEDDGSRTVSYLPETDAPHRAREAALQFWGYLDEQRDEIREQGDARLLTHQQELDRMETLPETEQDLYDALQEVRESRFGAERRQDELSEAGRSMWQAITDGDSRRAATVLDNYYSAHGSVEALIERFMPWNYPDSALRAALQQSNVPEEKWKLLTTCHHIVQGMRSRKLSAAEIRRYGEMQRRYEELQEYPELAMWLEAFRNEEEEVSPVVVQETLDPRDQRDDPELVSQESTRETAEPERQTPVPSAPPKPDILSTLTTTQTTRLPDGTVTTRMVLKQRFADGREETCESMQVDKEPTEKDRVHEEKLTNGKGWFWS